MPVQLSEALQEQIFQQMAGTYPNEGGGFLMGTTSRGMVIIEEIAQVENSFETEEQYHRYAMKPANWAKMEDEADSRGLALVGYYHSHPNAPAVPSEYDREHAFPNFVYVITSVTEDGPVEMRAWRLRDDRSAFDADDLEILS